MELENTDNIEQVFSEKFSDFEDLPEKDLWNNIKQTIPVYAVVPSSNTGGGTARFNGLNWVSWKTLLGFSSVIAVISGIYFFNSSEPVVTSAQRREAVETTRQAEIQTSSVAKAELLKGEATKAAIQTGLNKTEQKKSLPAIVEKEQSMIKSNGFQEKKTVSPVMSDTSVVKTENAEPVEAEHVKKANKKESFYEKKLKALKDSTRHVFTHE